MKQFKKDIAKQKRQQAAAIKKIEEQLNKVQVKVEKTQKQIKAAISHQTALKGIRLRKSNRKSKRSKKRC